MCSRRALNEILKDLVRSFTSKDNPAGTSKSNVQFQRDLSTMIRGDSDYYANPTLGRLCKMVASIMHMRERLTAESNRHVASGSSSTSSKTKTLRSREDSSTTTVGTSAATSRTCEGCNRPNHSRESFRLQQRGSVGWELGQESDSHLEPTARCTTSMEAESRWHTLE